jgi:hypothetical protein
MDKAIKQYLEARWKYYGKMGWQGSLSKETFIRCNAPHVKENLQDNPEYIKERTK